MVFLVFFGLISPQSMYSLFILVSVVFVYYSLASTNYQNYMPLTFVRICCFSSKNLAECAVESWFDTWSAFQQPQQPYKSARGPLHLVASTLNLVVRELAGFIALERCLGILVLTTTSLRVLDTPSWYLENVLKIYWRSTYFNSRLISWLLQEVHVYHAHYIGLYAVGIAAECYFDLVMCVVKEFVQDFRPRLTFFSIGKCLLRSYRGICSRF